MLMSGIWKGKQMKKKGFTLIELLVVIAIIAMLLAILMPALNKVKKIASRVVCGTNLKGLGTAQTVYGNDNDGEYAVQGGGGAHTWDDNITGDWQTPGKVWSTAGTITVGASLYLLVREADVSPKSFVCPSSGETVYDGWNPNNLDIVQVWDFASPATGRGPKNCVSYSYHQPYAAGLTGAASTGSKGRYPATDGRTASFAVMADKNPWFENPKLTRGVATANNYPSFVFKLGNGVPTTDAQILGTLDKYTIQVANAQPHDREGQNVLYADGHNSYETRSDVGVKNDNVYVMQAGTGGGPLAVRAGSMLDNKLTKTVPVGPDDSILVNDGPIAP